MAISFNSDQDLNKLIEKDVEELGKSFRDKRENSNNKVTKTQMRKFFEDIKIIERKMAAGVSFDSLRVEMLLMKPKVFYSEAKGNVSQKFKKDFCEWIDAANKSKEEFKRFCTFFEAVYAYHYANSEKEVKDE